MSDDNRRDNANDAMGLELLDDQAEAQVRRVWHEERWFFSVIDVIGLLTDSEQPRFYWANMKRRITDEGFVELLSKCQQLKMLSADGKQRLTDAADTETLMRIIQSIPSPKAEPFKQWLARVGAERLEEMQDPELAADRMRQDYRRLGYADDWIEKRMQGIIIRDELTGEWHHRGASDADFGALTNTIHKGTFDVGVAGHKRVKGIGQRANLRDNMTVLELLLTQIGEATATELHQVRDSQGLSELQRDTKDAGGVAGRTRRDIEAQTGRPVVSSENANSLTAKAKQPQLFSGDAAEQQKE
ncbi:MAG: hypothetical protein OJF49_002854 [Ktedonobacterales bacterium]|jgi:hypothetical protein|nr:MAG: hypothetical protein OJF49_002854 [Ktedonobacterales bacterium]